MERMAEDGVWRDEKEERGERVGSGETLPVVRKAAAARTVPGPRGKIPPRRPVVLRE